MSRIGDLIQAHIQFFTTNEKELFERARAYYDGDFFGSSSKRIRSYKGDMTTHPLQASKNYIFAIADSAMSAMLGPNPQVAAVPRNARAHEIADAISALANWVLAKNNIRGQSARALIDAILTGRGIFKTTWDAQKDRPVIRALDPATVFFDLSAREVGDISYWIEMTPVPWSVFQQRVASGKYRKPRDKEITPGGYPSGAHVIHGPLSDRDHRQTLLSAAHKWVTVWEVYDLTSGVVTHYHRDSDSVLYEGQIRHMPYSMFNLNLNSTDCRGLSEVQLLLDTQVAINDVLSFWMRVVYMLVPRILYDAGAISEDDLNTLFSAGAGAFVGINIHDSEIRKRLADLFFPAPLPEMPAEVGAFLTKMEESASFTSALAEAARGQVTGARTATEMAVLDAQLKTRLATRTANVNAAIETAARQALELCRRYMQEDKLLAVSGREAPVTLGLADLRDVEADFEMVVYNPIQKNPGVVSEMLVQLAPLLAQAPNVDMAGLYESIVELMGLPRKVIKSKAQMEREARAQVAQQQAQAQAQAGMAMGQAIGQQVAAQGGGPQEAMQAVLQQIGGAGGAVGAGGEEEAPAGAEAAQAQVAQGDAGPGAAAAMMGMPGMAIPEQVNPDVAKQVAPGEPPRAAMQRGGKIPL